MKKKTVCMLSCLCLNSRKIVETVSICKHSWYLCVMFIVESANSLIIVGDLVYVGSGDVLVVYCKDKGSQDLPPDNLYNPRLQSIERHPVLSELKRKNRVLSIYDKFHPHQVELLKKCCQQLWRYLRYWNKNFAWILRLNSSVYFFSLRFGLM